MKTELIFFGDHRISTKGTKRALFILPLVAAADIYFTRSAFSNNVTAGTLIRSILITSALAVQNPRTIEEAIKYAFLVYLVIYMSILTIFSPSPSQLLSWSQQTIAFLIILATGPVIAYILKRFGPQFQA